MLLLINYFYQNEGILRLKSSEHEKLRQIVLSIISILILARKDNTISLLQFFTESYYETSKVKTLLTVISLYV